MATVMMQGFVMASLLEDAWPLPQVPEPPCHAARCTGVPPARRLTASLLHAERFNSCGHCPLRSIGSTASARPPGQGLVNGLMIFLALCTILYFGREILIPVALAVLLSILLAPVVTGLQRLQAAEDAGRHPHGADGGRRGGRGRGPRGLDADEPCRRSSLLSDEPQGEGAEPQVDDHRRRHAGARGGRAREPAPGTRAAGAAARGTAHGRARAGRGGGEARPLRRSPPCWACSSTR